MGSNHSSEEDSKCVKPELLASALLAEVRDDDYFAMSMHTLAEFKCEDDSSLSSAYTASDALALEEAYKLAEPGRLNMENGYVRCHDGTFNVAVSTNLGTEISGEMFDWWIRQCDNSEKFRWWHPESHKSATWNPQFFAAMPHERQVGHYVDNIFVVEEKIGSELVTFHIEYVRPSKYFDIDTFEQNGVTACLVARLHMKDKKMGLISVGYVMHVVRCLADGTSELRSRYWLGHIAYPETIDNFVVASVINYVVNSYLYRLVKLPAANAKHTYFHCAQQMQCLKSFLPNYYRTITTGGGASVVGGSGGTILSLGGGRNTKKKTTLEEEKPTATKAVAASRAAGEVDKV